MVYGPWSTLEQNVNFCEPPFYIIKNINSRGKPQKDSERGTEREREKQLDRQTDIHRYRDRNRELILFNKALFPNVWHF